MASCSGDARFPIYRMETMANEQKTAARSVMTTPVGFRGSAAPPNRAGGFTTTEQGPQRSEPSE